MDSSLSLLAMKTHFGNHYKKLKPPTSLRDNILINLLEILRPLVAFQELDLDHGRKYVDKVLKKKEPSEVGPVAPLAAAAVADAASAAPKRGFQVPADGFH